MLEKDLFYNKRFKYEESSNFIDNIDISSKKSKIKHEL